jgi:peptide/nickel transport system substrate-binding protein
VRQIGLALVASALLGFGQAQAQEVLTIGVRSEASSLDPHWTQLSADLQVQEHIFEHLVDLDSASQPVPGLALSWAPIDETTWEFKLREGVTWHDGEAFNADDVIFSFDRLRAGIDGAPASPAFQLAKGGKQWTKIDDYTVHITTEGPYPTMAEDLAMLPIVAEHAAAGKTASVDFNSGAAAIGTGPFMFEEYSPGNRVTVVKNPNWWGGDPGWDRVIFRPVGEESARLAALLNGDVDIIDYPPTVDLPQLEANPDFTVSTIASDRLIYMSALLPAQGDLRHRERRQPDDEPAPRLAGAQGAEPRHQPRGDPRPDHGRRVAAREEHRAAGLLRLCRRARGRCLRPRGGAALLAEAGYPDGFRMTVHGPNDRYINDARIIEAVAQFWTQIGVTTEVDTMPRNIFFSDLIRGGADTFPGFDSPKFSMAMTGWGTVAGEATYTVSGILETYNAATGGGNGNFGRYSNPSIDAKSVLAKQTIDRDARLQLLEDATRMAMEDYALIPIHFQVNKWAMKAGLEHNPRTNERTLATEVRRVD